MVAGHETVPVAAPAGGAAFAWAAAALGLGAGIASMCVVLGCLTLVRNHGRASQRLSSALHGLRGGVAGVSPFGADPRGSDPEPGRAR